MTNVKSLALHAQAPNEGILWDESKRVKDSEGIDLIEATNPECEGKGAILKPVLQEAIRRKEVYQMATREEIISEVNKVPDQRLDELYSVVKRFTHEEASGAKEGFLVRLSRIQVEGPEDFATNFDLYLNGEKSID